MERTAMPGRSRGMRVALACTIIALAVLMTWQIQQLMAASRASRAFRAAEAARAAGRLGEAAGIYAEYAGADDSFREAAESALQALVLRDLPTAQPAAGLALLHAIEPLDFEVFVPAVELASAALASASAGAPRDLSGALALTDALDLLVPEYPATAILRERLLLQALTQRPEDTTAAVELARIWEASGEIERCRTLLEPFRGQLGTGEGARILGHALTVQGASEEAFALLVPYVAKHLNRFVERHDAYEQAVDLAWQQSAEQLQAGHAPFAIYQALHAVTGEERATLASTYLQHQVARVPDVRRARHRLEREVDVIAAALDLAVLHMARSDVEENAADREAQLDEAERLFDAIRRYAGDNGLFRLHYGCLLYRRGRAQEGRAQFEALLKQDERRYDALLAVARMLREAGEIAYARQLAEEAYEAAQDEAQRRQAAGLRAQLFVDLGDHAAWLERAGDDTPAGHATRLNLRGLQAISEGRTDDAVQDLAQAADAFLRMPTTAATLNNAAMAQFSLFTATGHPPDFLRGLDLLERAVSLDPGSAVLAQNAGQAQLQAAVLALLDERLDWSRLSISPSLDVLAHFHTDDNERRAWVERLIARPEYARALVMFERAVALGPRNPTAWQGLFQIYLYTRDLDNLRALEQRTGQADMDFSSEQQRLEALLSGENDMELRARLATEQARWSALVEGRSAIPRDTPFAIAATSLAEAHLQGRAFGLPFDGARVVRWAEQARAAAPSVRTVSMLISALLGRASEEIAEDQPVYAALVQDASRTLGDDALLAFACVRAATLAREIAAHPDVIRALGLIRERATAYPSRCDPVDWALFSVADPAYALTLAASIKADAFGPVERQLRARLFPLDARGALDACFVALLESDSAKAETLLREAAERGAPVPLWE